VQIFKCQNFSLVTQKWAYESFVQTINFFFVLTKELQLTFPQTHLFECPKKIRFEHSILLRREHHQQQIAFFHTTAVMCETTVVAVEQKKRESEASGTLRRLFEPFEVNRF
jgi:hypothetical protein